MFRGVLRKRLFILVAALTITPLILVLYKFIIGTYLPSEEIKNTKDYSAYSNLVKADIIIMSAFLALVVFVCVYAYFTVFLPLKRVNEGAKEMKKGTFSYRFNMCSNDEISEIAAAFDSMASHIEENHERLEMQNKELAERNWELQEANFELEASYGQLQATIEQLNEAEQKYHALVRNIPELVCVVNNFGTISFINHVCIDMLGYEKSELVGMNVMDLIAAKVSVKSINEIAERLMDQSSIMLEMPLKRKDGRIIITEASFTNYVYDGVIMGLQAIVRDITQKRKMEQQIVQSNRELAILNSVSKSITSTLDLDELTKLISDEITNTLNYPACVLRLVDSTGINLTVKAYSGEFFRDVLSIKEFETLDINDDIIGRAVNRCEVFKINQIPEQMLVSKINKTKSEKEKLKYLLFVPIRLKDKKIGVMSVGSFSSIREKDINLISSVANNAAVAIDNALLYLSSKKYFIRTIDALIAAVEAKDKYTEGHSQRVSKYAVDIAHKIGLSREQIEDIKVAGILHDIGKIGISDTILLKPGKLSDKEYEEIKQHPSISNKILYPVGFSDRALKAIAFHHERYDGTGYPFGLTGNDITIEAQIIAVADAYDAMTSNRSYRLAMSSSDALGELLKNKSTQFNPLIVDTLVDIVGKSVEN